MQDTTKYGEHIGLTEFLRKKTKAMELCAIRKEGWVIFTCWIDHEDIWLIPEKYSSSVVISDEFGELPIVKVLKNGDTKTIRVPCHYIDIGSYRV